jgi:hypothetical protein
MHAINGFVYCNGPTLQLKRGETVRWLVMGFGSEADMHSPVFDGQAVQYAGEWACGKGGMGGALGVSQSHSTLSMCKTCTTLNPDFFLWFLLATLVCVLI